MKLNKKGYMLVEIILASVIAFGVGYFMLAMVINLKNKNDDLLVETLTATDQAVIMNKLMDYAKTLGDDFDCNKISVNNNIIKYDGTPIDVVNDYATVGEIYCNYANDNLIISVPLEVKQLTDKDFNVAFNYNAEEETVAIPTEPLVCNKEFDACPAGWHWQNNGCFYYVAINSIDYTSGAGCTANCSQHSGRCSGTMCYFCSGGYHDYGSNQYCYKSTGYNECDGDEWEIKDGKCHNINCNGGNNNNNNNNNNDGEYTITFDCGDDAYWDRPSGTNIFTVSYDEFFNMPIICKARNGDKRHYGWVISRQGGNRREYYSGSTSFSDLVDNDLVLSSDKTATFYALWEYVKTVGRCGECSQNPDNCAYGTCIGRCTGNGRSYYCCVTSNSEMCN